MRIIATFLLLLLIAAAGIVLVSRNDDTRTREPLPTPLSVAAKPPMIKAVHYFSSSWPKSFWEDFEQSQVADDFAQIKADGFNTIILVLPWRGFETGFEDGQPEPSSLYERFEWLLTKIDQAGLDYGLRVSFPHNFDPSNGIGYGKLCTEIFTDSELRENWVKYLSRIAQRVALHKESFKFAFFSWEDFFCPYASIPNLPAKQRLEMARRSGYQSWLAEQYPLEKMEPLYGRTYNSLGEIPFPKRDSAAFGLFLRFIDQFLINQLLVPGREALPELAMEVRVDRDPVQKGGETIWAEHDLALADERMRGSYWGAYYGARNEGELLTADQALRNFSSMLDQVSDYGKNTNHIVEQFNFADNTPGYVGQHAQIKPEELPKFLEGAAKLLQQKSRGYGLWAYRDYVDSAIYNGSFELGLRGWETQGEVVLLENVDGDQALRLQPRSVISQTFAPFNRFAGLGRNDRMTFCANFKLFSEKATITLFLNGASIATLAVREPGLKCVGMDARGMRQAEVEFSILSNVEIQIDDLRLYTFVQTLNVYDHNGRPGPIRDLIVRLNTEWLAE